MTDHSSLPVPGYTTQSSARVAIVTQNKQLEERVLRQIDRIAGRSPFILDASEFDQRWVALGRSQIELGFMALNRAIFQPQRVALLDEAGPETAWDEAGPETAWLIEDASSPVSRPRYFSAAGADAAPTFSEDPLLAMRFARREDAEAFARMSSGAGWQVEARIAEHAFG